MAAYASSLEPLASGIRLRYVPAEPLEPGDLGALAGGMTLQLYPRQQPRQGKSNVIASGSGYTRGGPQSPATAGVVPVNQPSYPGPAPHLVLCRCAACTSVAAIPGCACPLCTSVPPPYALGGIVQFPPSHTPPPRKPGAFTGARGMDGFDGAPLVAGTPLGYRWWTLTAPRLHLDPAGAGKNWIPGPLRGAKDFWQPGVNKAKCLAAGGRRHDFSEIPCDSCADGFWAYWEIQQHDLGRAGELPVVGVVKASGQVTLGPRGFRAQKAEIIALHLPFRIEPDLPSPLESVIDRSQLLSPRRPPARFTGRVISFPGAPPVPPSLGGPPPVPAPLAPPPEPEPPSQEEIRAAKDRAEAWMAVIEDRLAVTYPGAEVCATLDLMTAKYPVISEYEPPEPRGTTQRCPYCGAPRTPNTIHRHLLEAHDF